MIETRLWEHLKTSVPGVQNRVFANIIAQDTVKPSIVYTVVVETVGAVGGCSDRNHREWEITLYGENYSQNKQIKEEIVAALKSFEVDVKNISIEDGFDTQEAYYAQHIQFNTGRK